MDGLKHSTFAAVAPDVLTLTFNGLSKSHLAAGFRAGWLTLSGPKDRAKSYIEGLNMLASMRLCSNAPAQHAIKPALENLEISDQLAKPGGRIYEQRNVICDALAKIDGISFVRPNSAFYVFPKLDVERFNIRDDEQFALDFLREKHVLLVPGSGFHWPEPDHFRIVFLPEAEALKDAVAKLGDFLSTYKQK
jgi:alanine-synthesizing transaminase